MAIKQTLISIIFDTHIHVITKLYLVPLNILWRHRVSRDSVLKGQISKGNICKSEWSIDFSFGVYLSWEEMYQKIAIIWQWCHLMNINEVMTFHHFVIYLSNWGKKWDFSRISCCSYCKKNWECYITFMQNVFRNLLLLD